MSFLITYTWVTVAFVIGIAIVARWMHMRSGRQVWSTRTTVRLDSVFEDWDYVVDVHSHVAMSFKAFSPRVVSFRVTTSSAEVCEFTAERKTLRHMVNVHPLAKPDIKDPNSTWFIRGKSIRTGKLVLVIVPLLMHKESGPLRLHVIIPFKLLIKALNSWEGIMPEHVESTHLADEIDADLRELFEKNDSSAGPQ